jgi:GT2 family glycosyltransferase
MVRTYREARRRAGLARALPLLAAVLAHYQKRVRRLRDERPAETVAARGASEDIRWMGPLDLGRVRHALFAHPDSRIVYRLQAVVPGARLVADCAMHPSAWGRNRSGVEFELTASCPATGWTATRSRLVNPTARWRDRAWRPLAIDLPREVCSELHVTLVTRCAGHSLQAWALWGEPRLEWPRSASDRFRLVRAAASRLRRHGPRAVLAELRDLRQFESTAAAYQRWVADHMLSDADLARARDEARQLSWQPLVSVIVPVYNTDPAWLRAAIASVRDQVYPHWELCLADDCSTRTDTHAVLQEAASDERIRIVRLGRNGGISAASNAALQVARGDLVALLDHDDVLSPVALLEVVKQFNEHPDADVVYSDEDKLDATGKRCDPYFKPDWSPELLLSFMYPCHLMVLRRSIVDQAGGFRSEYDGAQDYDLLLRVSERTEQIRHVPGVLYHWRMADRSTARSGAAKPWAQDAGRRALEAYLRATGRAADVVPGRLPGLFRVRYRIAGTPLVSIVIPTRGITRMVEGTGVDLLTTCLRSLVEKTAYRPIEIVLVVDRGNLAAAAAETLKSVRHRLVEYHSEGPFNFSRKINLGVSASSGAHVLLLNDDIEAIEADWLTAMLEFSQQPQIGAVGAKLYYPDGRLQHVGLLLGVDGVAAHAFHQHPGTSPGYAASNIVIRNCAAVTAACMLTRRDVFDSVGGFDEALAVDFNDVDYCLRVRRQGLRIVYTPYAELYHHESASFGTRTQNAGELAFMRERWGTAVQEDPYYNPFLTRLRPDYSLDV